MVQDRSILRKLVTKLDSYRPCEDGGDLNRFQSIYPPENFEETDRTASFFSEATLYHIFGKDAARVILAYWRQIKEEVENTEEG